MRKFRFLLTLAAFLAAAVPAMGAGPNVPPNVPPVNPPHDAPGRIHTAPAPVLGAGLAAIIAAGAVLAGYGLRRRKERSSDDH